MENGKPLLSGVRGGQRQNPDDDAQFDHAPYLNYNDGKVNFDTKYVDNPNHNYGSASGFVPKSLF